MVASIVLDNSTELPLDKNFILTNLVIPKGVNNPAVSLNVHMLGELSGGIRQVLVCNTQTEMPKLGTVTGYILGWDEGGVKTTVVRADAGYFFTANLTGCAIAIAEVADGEPGVLVAHANSPGVGEKRDTAEKQQLMDTLNQYKPNKVTAAGRATIQTPGQINDGGGTSALIGVRTGERSWGFFLQNLKASNQEALLTLKPI